MAKPMLTMLAAFGEFERELIRERQREGIALAKAKGVYKGRKKRWDPKRRTSLSCKLTRGFQRRIWRARMELVGRPFINTYGKADRVVTRPIHHPIGPQAAGG